MSLKGHCYSQTWLNVSILNFYQAVYQDKNFIIFSSIKHKLKFRLILQFGTGHLMNVNSTFNLFLSLFCSPLCLWSVFGFLADKCSSTGARQWWTLCRLVVLELCWWKQLPDVAESGFMRTNPKLKTNTKSWEVPPGLVSGLYGNSCVSHLSNSMLCCWISCQIKLNVDWMLLSQSKMLRYHSLSHTGMQPEPTC